MRIIQLCLLLGGFVSGFAQIDVDRNRLIKLLQQGKTKDVFIEASRLRDSVYGKCAVIDYFIGKSLCIDKHYKKSAVWFDYILTHYPLEKESRQFLESELASCTDGSSTLKPVFASIVNMPLPKATVRGRVGKGGQVEGCFEKRELIRYDKLISDEELATRVFDRNKPMEATSRLKSFLDPKYHFSISNRFILVSEKERNISDNQIQAIAESLERAYRFFVDYYALRPPDKFITVYLVSSKEILQELAGSLHGIDIGESAIGYSMIGDLSLLGVASGDPELIGTLYHELWHLVVRADIGDIPAWLDEGIASLYSNSSWRKDSLYGNVNNWRTYDLQKKRLQEMGVSVPDIREVIEYNWEQFNGGPQTDLCKAAINYSLTNHLMLYFQQQGLLKKVVQAIRDRGNPDTSTVNKGSRLIELVTGRDLAGIETDFQSWFKSTYQFDFKNQGGEGVVVTIDEFYSEHATISSQVDSLYKSNKLPRSKYTRIKKDLQSLRSEYSAAETNWNEENRRTTIMAPNAVMPNQVNVSQQAVQEPVRNNDSEKMRLYRQQMNEAKEKLKKMKDKIGNAV
jgi:hypothetical protein